MTEPDRLAVMAAGEASAFKAGDTFFEAGAPIDKIHFLVSGAVSTTMPMRDGSTVEVLLTGAEGAIGLLSVNGPVTAFGRVRAETAGTALAVPAQTLSELAHERASLRQVVNQHLAALVAGLARSAACNAVHKLEPRMAKCLLRFHDRLHGDELTLTQEHMSRMLGVSRTTLNAVAQSLQADGVLRYARGRIGILDRARLEAMACECYQPLGRFKEG